ncbi:hypothetical protein BDY21DRAFT_291983 [Lineolata rhizophorae]|uniref:NAD-dependent epimerase/dehydratase domain-containing protein n=1 Tax=Lineolata rhizophorae TaxID=578093 RepID=A0A6A6NQK7_9PEZI|nr:hypothetical protein BDY21DRAFT_291983 [Lineolata rhizophorae]
MAPPSSSRLPHGSLVMVTGANGLIGSHVADQLLLSGYRVRGAVRNADKSAWLTRFFADKYGPDKFELTVVPDMSAEGAYDAAVKDAVGIAHVASVMDWATLNDVNVVVPKVVRGVTNVLEAAAAAPSVRSVVFTSSTAAVADAVADLERTVDETTFNDEAVGRAFAPPPSEPAQRILDVYSAAKTLAEKAAWKFVEERKLSFVFNSIASNANFGRPLSVKDQGCASTLRWIRELTDGFPEMPFLKDLPPQYFVDVQDVARLHVAALTFEDVAGERIFACAEHYNWNDVLHIIRKKFPDRTLPDDFPGIGRDKTTVPQKRPVELLKRFGRSGWTTLEESVMMNLED